MGCCDAPGLMPLADAIERLRASLEPITETEQLPLASCLDRVLAEPITAPINVPGYDNSAMDGYALRHADLATGQPLTLAGKSFAGAPYEGAVAPGQCVRIMTGAVLPAGADTVIMQEDAEASGQQVRFAGHHKAGQHIRRAGSDIAAGQQVLTAGTRLGPTQLGLLASLGLAQLPVLRKLRVALLSSGDELRAPGQALAAGQIYDSNRYLLQAMLARLNVELLDLGVIPDQPAALRQAFIQARDKADLVISSGGVSVGEADYTRDILAELGEIGFWKIAIKPGKPLAFGRLGRAFFLGLPGNPVSAALTFHQVGLIALRALAGELAGPPLRLQLPTSASIRKRPGRTDYQRGVIAPDGLSVAPLAEQSSGVLSSMVLGNCYICLPQDSGDVAAGSPVDVIPFDRWLS